MLAVLRQRVDALPPGVHSVGLRAVVQHIDAAIGHLNRGQQTGNETSFTDAIYRTNQAFEGSLKEAYRVLARKDPARSRPAEIEVFLQDQKILRPRVLDPVARFRTEWRNPSTHDYRLDFDEDEALLAIVSICALAIVLVDQISENASFDAAKAAAHASSTASPTASLAERLVASLEQFNFAAAPSSGHPREIELIGAIRGHLTATIPGASVESESPLAQDRSERADLIAKVNDERVIIEVKRGRYSTEILHLGVMQLTRYAQLSGINSAILFLYNDRASSTKRDDVYVQPGDVRIWIVAPN